MRQANLLSRRKFVTGAGGTLLGLATGHITATAAPPLQHAEPATLRGQNFNLDIGYRTVNFTGRERQATTINQTIPGPVLRWREGERVTLRVTNHLAVDSSVHWHGMILPAGMDGVPRVSFDGIKPGETFRYDFDVQQSGTYWYHSHSAFQEQTGMYGAIVIDPLEPEPFTYDRDYVVLMSDWSDLAPEHIYARLKKQGDFFNINPRTLGDLQRDIKKNGIRATWNARRMWNEMRMSDRDLSDVSAYTYSYLMNGRTPDAGWTGLYKPGEKIRLRFINGAAMTFFDVRMPGLKMTVVAADGQYIEPVTVDEFRIGVAETYDVIVTPEEGTPYTIFAQSMDRTGYARGTLTPNIGATADVPPLDPVNSLTHADMGMGMGMDHRNHTGMDHARDMTVVEHAKAEWGPHVDMRAERPEYRLGDPGVGLRDNGRRVLTYADLANLRPTPDPREPEREMELHLTGNMHRYMWSINGVRFADAEPLRFRYGERIRLTLINDTMMSHPMHLHGMWSDLETGDGAHLPRKHTVIVAPGSRISYRVTADAVDEWAYHCHLLYHMPGMFRTVMVDGRTSG